ncbi:glycosyltransferase family 4 protein [Sphingomonas sp. NBWT7]|uniref:glycosyltransferase family 4 protein n=1 Tax=Sphingomonas sp. NBWT7 TaxID=2596913 RepID=UPI0016264EC0|nr:glycosyltransferase family 4 protein [Sphingomonas sp. NBWT7]
MADVDPSPAAGALTDRRIAILSHTHPSLSKGGAEIAARTLFRGLRASGVDAILISACDEAALDRLDLDPYEFALPYRSTLYDHFYHLSSIDVRRSLIALLQRERVALLNAHHFLNVGSEIFRDVTDVGIPVVFTIHEFLAICHNHGQLIKRHTNALCDGPTPGACRACYPEHSRQQFAVRQQHFAAALAPVAAFVSPSHFLADTMVRNGLPADRVHVIENGIEQGRASPTRSVSRRRIWTFSYFGQINPFKGMDVLLDACAIIARDEALCAQIRIVVHGNMIGQSPAFIERFDAACERYPFLRYAGAYDNGSVADLMAACDYVVFPSTWWENSPVVIQEAFQARRPVLCTGIGGMAEKVTDRVNGLHFLRGDPADLADRIAEASDLELYGHLQQAIPPVLSPTQMAERYLAIFEDVSKAGAPGLLAYVPDRI